MEGIGALSWPPAPITTPRLTLRATQAGDRAGFVALRTSDEVYRFLGGAAAPEAVEATLPSMPGERPGCFAAEHEGAFVGCVSIDRREPHRPGTPHGSDGVLELSYLFLPEHWGQGYATEAVGAVLSWADAALPPEPVFVCTQSANLASVRLARRLGFSEVERFVEFGAEQWFGVRAPTPA